MQRVENTLNQADPNFRETVHGGRAREAAHETAAAPAAYPMPVPTFPDGGDIRGPHQPAEAGI
jgi:hypothetical protein